MKKRWNKIILSVDDESLKVLQRFAEKHGYGNPRHVIVAIVEQWFLHNEGCMKEVKE